MSSIAAETRLAFPRAAGQDKLKGTVLTFTLPTKSGYHLLQLGAIPPIIYDSVCRQTGNASF